MANDLLKLSPYSVDGLQTPGFNYSRFQDKLDTLPEDLVELLLDPATTDFVQSLTQKYIQLSVQGPDMARLIRDVTIGDIFIGDMPKEISHRLGIDQTFAREITNLIVSQLFTPVIEDIKKVQNERYPGKLPRQNFAPQNSGGQAPKPTVPPAPATQHYQGEELPESGGNIIDLRNTK
ncbi:MAG: hypothetical protein HYT65_02455 [Candidatus Yanofskybacteria bacterium]|nr:hypothetical protein [Candidatus Yanofskybacteria bacterium]